ncbi:helix-turn-helix domain-containing protein [Rubrivivax sp. JA1024]|nr:helix-turn-helix domain-containing protein [Rubrivivax sp. JA1024]
MTDPVTPPPEGTTAGALLRAAREKQGLHIAALAASIKVPVAKLEALEADQYASLPDAAFTRALAQAVCRALRTDPQPVLALLPQTDGSALDHVVGNLNTPFRERAGPDLPKVNLGAVRPMAWAGGALLVAAAVVYFMPSGLLQPAATADAPLAVEPAAPAELPVEPAAEAPASAVPQVLAAPVLQASQAVAAPVVAQPSAPPSVAQAATPPATPAARTLVASAPVPAAASRPSLVQLHADGASWVEAYDGKGQLLFSRLLQAGESAGVEGQLPIRLKIGNAPATRLVFRGQPVDLAPLTRNAVARVELQ